MDMERERYREANGESERSREIKKERKREREKKRERGERERERIYCNIVFCSYFCYACPFFELRDSNKNLFIDIKMFCMYRENREKIPKD